MAKKTQSEDPTLSKICDLVMGSVVMVASASVPARSKARAIELYLGVMAFCDSQLCLIQGPNDPLLRRMGEIVAPLFGLKPSDLMVKSRVWPRSQARAMLCLLLHESGCSLKRCSEIIGLTPHSLKYQIRTLRAELSVNAELADKHVKAKNRLHQLRNHE